MPARAVLPRLYCIVDAGSFAAAADPAAAAAAFTRDLLAGGATLLQYRNKSGNPRQILAGAQAVLAAARTPGAGSVPRLILNDRADLALIAGYDGVHVGQEDLSPEAARRVFGTAESAGIAATAGKTPSGTRHSVLGTRYSQPGTRNSAPGTRNSVLGTRNSGLGTRDSQLGTRHSVLGTRYSLWVGVSTHSPEQIAAADESSADYLAIGPVFATASKHNPDAVVGLEGVRRARQLTRKPLVAIGGITRQNCRAVLDAGADSVAVISDLLHDPRRAVEEFLRLLT